jgi:hypothetical protein
VADGWLLVRCKNVTLFTKILLSDLGAGNIGYRGTGAGADEMWERFGDTLSDMEPYWTITLSRIDSLSHTSDED